MGELLRATVAGMTEPGKVVIVGSESVEKAMAAARQAAMDGDDEKFKAYTTSIVNRVQHVVTVASSEVENSEDPNFRMPVQAAAAKLREIGPAVVNDLAQLAGNPQDASK